MARPRSSAVLRRDARELATTPVTNPYRHQLTDPYQPEVTAVPRGRRIEFDLVPSARPGQRPDEPVTPTSGGRTAKPHRQRNGVTPTGRVRTPWPASTAAALGFALGAAHALFGVMLAVWTGLQEQLGPDRSFHVGGDRADLVVALIDLTLACTYVIASVAFGGGRVAGRMTLTIAGWTTLFLCAWWTQADTRIRPWLPWSVGVVVVAMMLLAYAPRVTRWLGVLPVPQPE